MLPEDFKTRMEKMLAGEYGEFLASFGEENLHSLRVNPLKGGRDAFLSRAPFALTQMAWEENGFYYGGGDVPGKHPFHEAGAYYIQEASAMAPVAYLDVRPGQRVLDLCAAPGGKSTQIAGKMRGKGILFCNEVHPARAKILSENIERLGVTNAVVTNETVERLADFFENYFDRILVDAPCSGEGMFRKNEDACGEWSLENVRLCAERQDAILNYAAGMLKPGGRLVYSTCTFAPEENEGSISRFLRRHREFSLCDITLYDGMEPGRPEWENAFYDGAKLCSQDRGMEEPKETPAVCKGTARLWPHRLMGEGHFLAVLQKEGETPDSYGGYCRNPEETGILEKRYGEYLDFMRESICGGSLRSKFCGRKIAFGDNLYQIPEGMPQLSGLKVMRPGLHLGTLKKNRFEPSHALAQALKKEDVPHSLSFLQDSAEIREYLSGMTVPAEGENGWYLVCVEDYSLGWGKLSGGILKNHYPKGLRRQL